MNLEKVLNKIKEESTSIGYNTKFLFRHSNRPSLKGVEDSLSVGITEEGAQKAYLFGKSLPWLIGTVSTSISKRCVQTSAEIVRGSKSPEVEIIQSQTLTSPAIADVELVNKICCSVGNLKNVVYMLSNGNTLPGIYPIRICSRKDIRFYFFKWEQS